MTLLKAKNLHFYLRKVYKNFTKMCVWSG